MGEGFFQSAAGGDYLMVTDIVLGLFVLLHFSALRLPSCAVMDDRIAARETFG